MTKKTTNIAQSLLSGIGRLARLGVRHAECHDVAKNNSVAEETSSL